MDPSPSGIAIELIFVSALLPIYEFVITFDQEVAAVWLRDRKLSLGAVLLVSTRWCMVLLAIMSLTPVTTTVRDPPGQTILRSL